MPILDHRGRPIVRNVVRQDGWANIQTGLGVQGLDKTRAGRYEPIRRVLDPELTSLMNGSHLARKIVFKRADEMFRRGFALEADNVKSSEIDELRDYATDVLRLETNFRNAKRWGRGYGGCLLLMGIDDGRYPWEPLDEDNIRDFYSLSLVDRRYSYLQSQYAGIGSSSQYGEARIYLVSNAVAGYGWENPSALDIRPKSGKDLLREGAQVALVHESRVIRFDGNEADVVTRQQLAGWSWSVLQVVYDELRRFEGSFDAASYLLSDASQGVFKLAGMMDAIASGHLERFLRRLTLIEQSRSVLRGIALDAGSGEDGKGGEDFTRVPTPFAGIPDLLDKMMLIMSSAADMPATELFGRAPAGLNATGESDTRKWYDTIESEQKNDLGPQIKRLFRLLARSKKGPLKGRDVRWKVRFHPLWSPTDKELADTRLANAQRDAIYLENGVIKPEEIAVDLDEVYPNMDVAAREKVLSAGLRFDPYENEPPPKTSAVIAGLTSGEPLSPAAPMPTLGVGPAAGEPASALGLGVAEAERAPKPSAVPGKPVPTGGKSPPPRVPVSPSAAEAQKQAAAEEKTPGKDDPKLEEDARADAADEATRVALPALLAGREDADAARAVFEQLLGDYHAKDLGWVLPLTWTLQTVPLSRINFAARDRWRASHDGTLQSYIDKLRAGHIKPVILVEPPDALDEVVDGHHRTLASEALGRDAVAYVAKVPSLEGPWLHLHSLQKKGSSKVPGGGATSREASRDQSRLPSIDGSRLPSRADSVPISDLPDDFGTEVPAARGSSCADCRYLIGGRDGPLCMNATFVAWAHERLRLPLARGPGRTVVAIPAPGGDPKRYCCSAWQAAPGVLPQDAHDPDHERDPERGTFAERAATKASRAADDASTRALEGGAHEHHEAAKLHAVASKAHRELAGRHGELGNARAQAAHHASADRHARIAAGHILTAGGLRQDYSEDQPRVPAGESGGGQFAPAGGGGGGGPSKGASSGGGAGGAGGAGHAAHAPSAGDHHGGGFAAHVREASAKAKAFLAGAHANVKSFFTDHAFRQKAIATAAHRIRSAPRDIVQHAIGKVKEQVHEAKTAFAGVKAVLHGGSMTDEQKHAVKRVALKLAVAVASRAIAGALPVEFIGSEIGRKVVEKIGHHVAEHVLSHVVHHATGVKLDAALDIDPEEWLGTKVAAGVADALEDLSGDDVADWLEDLAGEDGDEGRADAQLADLAGKLGLTVEELRALRFDEGGEWDESTHPRRGRRLRQPKS